MDMSEDVIDETGKLWKESPELKEALENPVVVPCHSRRGICSGRPCVVLAPVALVGTVQLQDRPALVDIRRGRNLYGGDGRSHGIVADNEGGFGKRYRSP